MLMSHVATSVLILVKHNKHYLFEDVSRKELVKLRDDF
jgi:hypothetical protein